MSHQFHNAFHSTADGLGVLNIGPAEVEIDRPNLRAFVDGIASVEGQRQTDDPDSPQHAHVVNAPIIESTDWSRITFVAERNTYAVTYRGVSWEASAPLAIAAAAEAKAYLESTQ